MKKVLILLGVLGGGVATAIALNSKKKKKAIDEEPPKLEEAQSKEPIDPFGGEGLQLINNRMESINNSNERQRIIDSMNINWYGGINDRSKNDFLQVISSIFGSQFPEQLILLDNNFSKFLQTIVNQSTFVTDGNYQADLNRWRSISKYSDSINFFPLNFRDRFIEQNQLFKVSGDADGNRSERFTEYFEALQTFAANLLNTIDKYEKSLRNKATSDLLQAGYKFIGL